MKVALVHEFLTQYGGAEKVLEAILEIFPDATIHTLVYDKEKMGKFFGKYKIKTSFLQKMPFGVKKYKWYLTLMPKAIESFDFTGYDLVLSDASAFAKGVITKKPTVHICYCHTPTRYLWQETKSYVQTAEMPNIIRPLMPPFIKALRKWDYKAAQRPDYIIANSQTVQKRIKKYYKRDSTVIYPFVDIQSFSASDHVKNFYLIAGRMVPYKRNDIVVQAFNKLSDKTLIVAGAGYGLEELKTLASSSNIKFKGRVSDESLKQYFSTCRAFIFAAEEDFGITPLEAMASGRPVIAYGVGGATETIVDGKTGIFFNAQTPEAVIDAINKFEKKQFNQSDSVAQAKKFEKKQFIAKMKTYINDKMSKKY